MEKDKKEEDKMKNAIERVKREFKENEIIKKSCE